MKGWRDEKIRVGRFCRRSKSLMAIRDFFFTAILLLYSPSILAQEISRICDNGSLISQFAVEAQFSPLGAVIFDDIGRGWNREFSFGLGFQHRCNLRPMLRNTVGGITKAPFARAKIAKTDEIELVLIQPITAIFARAQSAELRPYFGWGFSLAVLEDVSLLRRTRGYSVFVFETGLDIAETEFADAGSFRISLRSMIGEKRVGLFILFGTVLRPAPILDRFVH